MPARPALVRGLPIARTHSWQGDPESLPCVRGPALLCPQVREAKQGARRVHMAAEAAAAANQLWQMHLSTFTVCVGATLLFAFLVLLAGHRLGGLGECHFSCGVACVTGVEDC